ncbi:MAG: exosortase U, partial [Pirellulaceae bacterium]
LLAILWQPPWSSKLTGDVILTSSMQRLSTKLVSQLYDLMELVHVNHGTVISIPGLEMGVEEACSGIQSLFLYIAVGALCGVFFRRSWSHTCLLMMAGLGWALVTNTARIFTIGVGHAALAIDLTHGVLHELLGYAVMLFGIGLMASFDQLLLSCLPKWIHTPASTIPSVAVPKLAVRQFRGIGVGLAGMIVFLFVCQLLDIGALTANRKSIDFFAGDSIIDVGSNWLPDQIDGWEIREYRRDERSNVSDLGQRSDVWVYAKADREVTVSFDQVFPGWHELTRCYEGRGWRCQQRGIVAVDGQGTVGVSAKLNQGGDAIMLFAMLDRGGNALSPPQEWDMFSSLFHRIRNRLSPRVRASLFGAEAYQIQVFSAECDEQTLAGLLRQSLSAFQQRLGDEA